MTEFILPGLEIFQFLLSCGTFGLLVDMIFRQSRLEAKTGLCKACPITTIDTITKE
ncbi:MAG: hypothetical protein Q4Q53_08610 [Methanocorpusculum sp.]|nr:hypothetical protein [Methanocorpusculum sp.]